MNSLLPLISIIIPAYNVAGSIKMTVESLFRSTYSNIEIVIINDGSVDETRNICEMMAIEDERIVLYNTTNNGVSIARNIGIRKSKGEFIAFIDADDECEPKYIESLYKAITKDNSDISICGYWSVLRDGRRIGSYKDKKNYFTLKRNEAERKLIRNEIGFHPWGKLYKKHIISDILFPIGKTYEDVYRFPDILDKCSKVAVINDRLVYYYQNEKSIIHIQNPINEYCAFDAGLLVYKKYINRHPDLEEYLINMPTEVAIRLRIMSFKDKEIKQYINIKRIRAFLKWVKHKKIAYNRLDWRYKLALRLII